MPTVAPSTPSATGGGDPPSRERLAREQTRRFRVLDTLTCLAYIAVVSVLAGWFVFRPIMADPTISHILRTAALPAGLLALVLLVAWRHEKRWSRPSRQLLNVLQQIRRGEAPMDDLDAIEGGPAIFVPAIRQLVEDLKLHKRQLRQVEHEMQALTDSHSEKLEQTVGALRKKAARDQLTGLNNRNSFDESFEQLVDRSRRAGEDLCVVMIDVDYFKQLNDTKGHAAGDELLQQIGQLIRSAVRERDEAFRYGGDEFVLVLPGTDATSGRKMAERLSRLVEELGRQYRVELPPKLTAGVAHLHAMPAADGEDLLKAADADLYRQKHARPIPSRGPVPAKPQDKWWAA